MSTQMSNEAADGWEIQLERIRQNQEWAVVPVAPNRFKVTDKRGVAGHDGVFTDPNEASLLCQRLNRN